MTHLRHHLVVGSMAQRASKKSRGFSSFLPLPSESTGAEAWGCVLSAWSEFGTVYASGAAVPVKEHRGMTLNNVYLYTCM